MGPAPIPVEQRYWPKVDRRGPNECWPWIGGRGRRGYGVIRVGQRQARATHVALALAGRPLESGQMACHTCDNPPCVNPAHLFAGTNRDNMRDGVAKGRPIGTYTRTPEILARLSAALRASFAGDHRNTLRERSKTHCPSGHPYDAANTYVRQNGSRQCRACGRAQWKARHA